MGTRRDRVVIHVPGEAEGVEARLRARHRAKPILLEIRMEQTLDNVAGEAVDSEIAVEAIRLLVEIVDILLVEIVDILGAAHRRRQLRRRS